VIPLAERIDYLPLNDRPKIRWPGDARVAFWVIPNVEFHEFMPPPRKSRLAIDPISPDPDMQGNVHRDYGNRIGFWRMLEVLDRHRIRCTVNINLALLERLPEERDAMVERSWDFCCHGFYNSRTEPKDLSEDEERAFYRESIASLARTTGKRLKGINVLGRATERMPDLIAEAGLIYHADWLHDDQPTPINVASGKLVSIPYAGDLNDSLLVTRNRPWEMDELLQMCKDRFDRLYAEGAENGMVMCLAIHPWVIGHPHRIGYLDRILEYVMGHDRVWQTTADDIAEYYIASYYDRVVAHAAKVREEQATLRSERAKLGAQALERPSERRDKDGPRHA
jgi:peptidoglycan/xylan/chitin deacetylase (PgdA/CDA1 family)